MATFSVNVERDPYASFYIHAVPKGMKIEVIEDKARECRLIRIGDIEIVFFDEEVEDGAENVSVSY